MTALGIIRLLRLAWTTARLPVLACLVVFEPIVRTVLSLTAILGILISLFFEFLIALPGFPFWDMLGISVSAAVLLMVYYGLIRLFSAG